MAKGTTYGAERAILRDTRSGLRVIRLTHYSTISMNLYFEMCSFTKDDQHAVFVSQRGAGRDAPWDLFRARTDGLELVQMTDCDDLSGVVVSPAAGVVVYQSNGEIRTVDIPTLAEKTIARIPSEAPAQGFSLGSIDAAGKTYFGACPNSRGGVPAAGGGVLFRVDLDTGKVHVLYEGAPVNHIHVDPPGRTVYFGEPRPEGGRGLLIDADGRNLRPYPFPRFAHLTWFGETGMMQGTLLPPGHAIVTYREGGAEPETITEGRYYWHSSASLDAQWIISDTNWPQEGLYLVHVPSGTVSYVCDPGSSPSHPQWTHPHPALSPNMRYVLFNSDATGLGQVYVAELTGEFLAQAAQGYLCRPNPGP